MHSFCIKYINIFYPIKDSKSFPYFIFRIF